MAKLSDRQKGNIKSKWDTGQYSKTQLAKTYKVNEKTIRDIVGKEEPKNAHIVEAQLMVENLKNSEKTPSERQAINQAVEYRLKTKYADDNKRVKVYDTTDKILDKVNALLDKGKKQVVMKVKEYSKDNGSIESLDVIDIDLDTTDLKNMQETVDKASITNNVNQRHAPKTTIENSNNQQNNTQFLSQEEVMKAVSEALPD